MISLLLFPKNRGFYSPSTTGLVARNNAVVLLVLKQFNNYYNNRVWDRESMVSIAIPYGLDDLGFNPWF
jgi:hypothetical protein